jgi:hypothetical protein
MNLASAYPNSDLSALSMTIIAVVMASTLAAWLILVFLADRRPRPRDGADVSRAGAHEAVWTEDQLREAKERPLPRAEGRTAVVSEEPGAYATSDER